MPPTPAPIIINMPSTGTPWWAPYLLAGLFVLFGAAIGLLSTRLSDKRKSGADDLRQWDKEIRDLYLEADAAYRVIRQAWWSRVQDDESDHVPAERAVEDLDRITSSLGLIANELTVNAARSVTAQARVILDLLRRGTPLSGDQSQYYVNMRTAHEMLLERVKKDIRTHGRTMDVALK